MDYVYRPIDESNPIISQTTSDFRAEIANYCPKQVMQPHVKKRNETSYLESRQRRVELRKRA